MIDMGKTRAPAICELPSLPTMAAFIARVRHADVGGVYRLVRFRRVAVYDKKREKKLLAEIARMRAVEPADE